MLFPVSHPLRSTAWANPATWPAIRAKVRSLLYPSGFSSRMDSVIEGYASRPGDPYPPVIALPTGCSRLDLMANATPGGRAGGTPQFVTALHPSATFTGTTLFHQCGLVDYGSAHAWDGYYSTPGRSVILAALALGWRVVVLDQIISGYNPGSTGNPVTPCRLNYGGSVQSYSSPNDVYAVYADGGSAAERICVDDFRKAINECEARYGSSRYVYFAHCGQSGWAGFALCCEERFDRIAMSRMWAPTVCQPQPDGLTVYGSIYHQTEVPVVDYWSVAVAGFARPGVKTLLTAAASDPGQPIYNPPKWLEWYRMIGEVVAPLGCSIETYLCPDPTDHQPQAAEVSRIMAHLQS